jgi:pyridinium-3,5-biscarboxylic acid mononucleotide sulfurtransferase
MMATVSDKKKALIECLPPGGPIIISFSGGVDSSLLAAVARECRGDQVRCILLDSPLVPRKTVLEAVKTAEDLGVPCEVIPFPVMEVNEFRCNPKNRCYLCKKMSSRILRAYAERLGSSCVADGMNASDLHEYRPGLCAATEEGIRHPFIEAGITKTEIREIAKNGGFPFWDKPSSACLASRIPYREEITAEKLQMIEKAESFLAGQGFTQVRVRLHDTSARIELIPEEMEKAFLIRGDLIRRFHEIGFHFVTLDLSGFRSGSMDEVS